MNNKENDEYYSPIQVIEGAARTELVQSLNGSPKQGQNKRIAQYLDGKAYSKDGLECEVSALSPASPYSYKYIIRLDEGVPNWDQIMALDPNLRATKGLYMIKYIPRGSREYKKGRPFRIGQDLVRWNVHISGYKAWTKLAEVLPEFRWLFRNSTLTENMFRIAVEHPGMALWFSIKWDEYEAMLKQKSQSVQKGLLMSRKTSVAEYKTLPQLENTTLKIRYFNDILKEINEVEATPAVQEEMLAEAGEAYNRSRKLNRDPVTGQFQKHKED